MPLVDEIVSDEQTDVTASAAVYSSADTVAQMPGAETDAAQSTASPKSEPVFASASAKPKPELKSDLSSMFKSLSAKMMMKRVRQSRFSHIAHEVSVSSESSGAVAVTENSFIPTGTEAGIESNHLLHMSDDAGALRTNTDTVVGDTNNGGLLPPFSHSVPLSISDQSKTLTFGLQNYDMQNMTGGSLSLSSIPVCPPPLPPCIITSTQNNSIITMTHGVPAVPTSLPGL